MSSMKVAITLDAMLLKLVDRWVVQGRYPNRSRAIQEAVKEKFEKWKRLRLTEELSKINPKEEKELASEHFIGDQWPEY